jgi:hypothetical protein
MQCTGGASLIAANGASSTCLLPHCGDCGARMVRDAGSGRRIEAMQDGEDVRQAPVSNGAPVRAILINAAKELRATSDAEILAPRSQRTSPAAERDGSTAICQPAGPGMVTRVPAWRLRMPLPPKQMFVCCLLPRCLQHVHGSRPPAYASRWRRRSPGRCARGVPPRAVPAGRHLPCSTYRLS